jgi:hypothetical protein
MKSKYVQQLLWTVSMYNSYYGQYVQQLLWTVSMYNSYYRE